MKTKTKEEKDIISKCREICNRNNKEDSIDEIKKKYPGCAIDIAMYGGGYLQKMYSGMIMWRNYRLSF